MKIKLRIICESTDELKIISNTLKEYKECLRKEQHIEADINNNKTRKKKYLTSPYYIIAIRLMKNNGKLTSFVFASYLKYPNKEKNYLYASTFLKRLKSKFPELIWTVDRYATTSNQLTAFEYYLTEDGKNISDQDWWKLLYGEDSEYIPPDRSLV